MCGACLRLRLGRLRILRFRLGKLRRLQLRLGKLRRLQLILGRRTLFSVEGVYSRHSSQCSICPHLGQLLRVLGQYPICSQEGVLGIQLEIVMLERPG